MYRFAPLLLLALCGTVIAADDLKVLKPDPGDTPPNKLLHSFLLKECQKEFDARKAEVEKLKTPEEIGARQERLRKQFVAALGGFPQKTPLNAKTVGTLKRDGYRIEKVIYESRPEHHVTANLYIPDGDGPFPAVLMPLGHSSNGKAADYMQRGAILLVKNGFVALVYDPIGQGERNQLLTKLGEPALKGSTTEHTMCGIGALLTGRCTANFRIWDGIRSIDYLVSRPEVDAKRIGCTGCSGGGTLTSYLMALDDRIAAAAPSCYLTSLERLFATIGPQDAEQNVPGQVAIGLDHADYIFLRAPKPTILLASTRDFFDIQGTWDTFREAKRVYTKLGFPERLSILEFDGSHGYPAAHREGMARFFSRWLKGEDKTIVETQFPIEKDRDLWCTRTGQVLEDLKGRSVFDLNAELAAELAKQRAAKAWEKKELRKEVARVIGLPGEIPALGRWPREQSVTLGNGLDCSKFSFHSPLGVEIPAAFFGPGRSTPTQPGSVGVMIVVHEGGKEAAQQQAIKLAAKGRHVVAVDLRGYGETSPGTVKQGRPSTFGVEYKEAFIGMHLGRPLLGQRAADLLSVLNLFSRETEATGFELMGVGSAAPVVLHAAALDDRIKSITIESGLTSWDNVVRTPISANQLGNTVPGALAVYDLPDLAAAIAPRPLTIRKPLDATGQPAGKDEIERAYRAVRAAYEKAGAAEKLKIE